MNSLKETKLPRSFSTIDRKSKFVLRKVPAVIRFPGFKLEDNTEKLLSKLTVAIFTLVRRIRIYSRRWNKHFQNSRLRNSANSLKNLKQFEKEIFNISTALESYKEARALECRFNEDFEENLVDENQTVFRELEKGNAFSAPKQNSFKDIDLFVESHSKLVSDFPSHLFF